MTALAIYCINLDKRTDRWNECLANYLHHGLPPEMVTKWKACEDAEFGALGCARSHVAVLADYLTNRSEPYCLVLEDDFDLLRQWNDFVNDFNLMQSNRLDWDALLFAGTSTIAYTEAPKGLARIIESQSTCGYLVARGYVPQLLRCFSKSIVMLEKFRDSAPRVQWTDRFAIDQAWKNLQRTDRWYIFTPALGHQRPSYSDIEQKTVDYSKMSWRGSNS